ncbi:tetraacyldisaccharide 4'-kinase [Endozoicomonas sp. ALB115]|uniref:tetraacyldisaccharide 4'-kinase n=1 Tax=Endozoicomonas sp. ALB115 TaxID=3403074 RepID=UPI003BB6CA7D
MKLWPRFSQSVTDSWYAPAGGWTRCLKPLSWLFSFLAARRKQRLLQAARWSSPVPVIVVGNISVGGTGKTPLVAALVREFQRRGYRPGIISRGFGAKTGGMPLSVRPDSDPAKAGDEPVMLARQLHVPLIVDVDRVKAARYLCDQTYCNLIIADDGLQHYNLQRHIEVLVLDGDRLLGNQLCLPAGPLREPPERMSQVDMILVNTNHASLSAKAEEVESSLGLTTLEREKLYCFSLEPSALVSMTGISQPIPDKTRVHGVAGIGNPERFFNTLRALGYDVIGHPYPDHHVFAPEDICFNDDLPVIMTAKDAVKCSGFADHRHWYLPVTTRVSDSCIEQLVAMIEARKPVFAG